MGRTAARTNEYNPLYGNTMHEESKKMTREEKQKALIDDALYIYREYRPPDDFHFDENIIWKCRRCKAIVNMEKFRCECTESPSPWEPVKL
jgi:hypothetical protein